MCNESGLNAEEKRKKETKILSSFKEKEGGGGAQFLIGVCLTLASVRKTFPSQRRGKRALFS